jgi:hypothetical protein
VSVVAGAHDCVRDRRSSRFERVSTRIVRILDAAPLVRRGVVVLELDAPAPLVGVQIGAEVVLTFEDGGRESVALKGLGFASSTPDHAHIIVAAPKRSDVETLASVQLA